MRGRLMIALLLLLLASGCIGPTTSPTITRTTRPMKVIFNETHTFGSRFSIRVNLTEEAVVSVKLEMPEGAVLKYLGVIRAEDARTWILNDEGVQYVARKNSVTAGTYNFTLGSGKYYIVFGPPEAPLEDVVLGEGTVELLPSNRTVITFNASQYILLKNLQLKLIIQGNVSFQLLDSYQHGKWERGQHFVPVTEKKNAESGIYRISRDLPGTVYYLIINNDSSEEKAVVEYELRASAVRPFKGRIVVSLG
ncbi:hypothetical protein [Pyrococcus yayanosii]|uniref:Lipoprotein n=1 Tax=Pyrococcus yayanosii (strain CH1 / JCM 16557) TaxID=529709 RepID=F8AI42_PYRYC|nr:hypothetical protein [Pyrococcus yayanosii]AEH24269.1 hypothetical protein PYCH_05810 [Pyrococcus yayanosii CH1]